jgi:hypothetical protein
MWNCLFAGNPVISNSPDRKLQFLQKEFQSREPPATYGHHCSTGFFISAH